MLNYQILIVISFVFITKYNSIIKINVIFLQIDDLQHKIKQLQSKEKETKDYRFRDLAAVDAGKKELENKFMKLQNNYTILNDRYNEVNI